VARRVVTARVVTAQVATARVAIGPAAIVGIVEIAATVAATIADAPRVPRRSSLKS